MGLNWERLSLSGYLESLEAHNAAQEGAGSKPKAEPSDWLRNAVKVWAAEEPTA